MSEHLVHKITVQVTHQKILKRQLQLYIKGLVESAQTDSSTVSNIKELRNEGMDCNLNEEFKVKY